MKLKNAPLIGRIMMIVGSLSIILQVIANKTVDLISKKESSLTNIEKVLIKFRGLLLGSETKIELPSFGSFIGFVWLGLLGIVLFSVGFRIMREERVEAWVMLLVVGGSAFALSFLCLLFTDASSVFSLTSSTTRAIRIFQHFWHFFLSIPLLIASYFAHKFFRKKHAVEFGEA
ncbi:MAG: hypothetical protein MRZ26_07565 [Ruminococcus sp.]|nr:hypothetical protein [Ruminococcus sp.]